MGQPFEMLQPFVRDLGGRSKPQALKSGETPGDASNSASVTGVSEKSTSTTCEKKSSPSSISNRGATGGLALGMKLPLVEHA